MNDVEGRTIDQSTWAKCNLMSVLARVLIIQGYIMKFCAHIWICLCCHFGEHHECRSLNLSVNKASRGQTRLNQQHCYAFTHCCQLIFSIVLNPVLVCIYSLLFINLLSSQRTQVCFMGTTSLAHIQPRSASWYLQHCQSLPPIFQRPHSLFMMRS